MDLNLPILQIFIHSFIPQSVSEVGRLSAGGPVNAVCEFAGWVWTGSVPFLIFLRE